MSLKTCRDCGKAVSKSADKCPHCGRPRRRNSPLKIIIAALVLLFAITFISRLFNQPVGTAASTYDPIGEARGACLIVLNKSLNDPDSAKLDDIDSWYTHSQSNGTTVVQPSGRAKNAFGAYVHGTWNCVTRHEGDKVRVLSLKQIRP